MARWVVFTIGIICLFAIVNLRNMKKLEVNNDRFDMKVAEENHKKEVALQEELHLLEMKRKGLIKEPEQEEVEEEKYMVVLDTPQLERGHKLYAKCISCHGRLGEGKKSQKAPAIGGQHAWYIVSSMKKMKSGERVNVVMNPFLKPLDEQDMEDIGAYLAAIPFGQK